MWDPSQKVCIFAILDKQTSVQHIEQFPRNPFLFFSESLLSKDNEFLFVMFVLLVLWDRLNERSIITKMIDLLIYENRYRILRTSIMTWWYNYWMLFYLWVLDTYYPGTQEWRNKSLSRFPGKKSIYMYTFDSPKLNIKSSNSICLPVCLKIFIFFLLLL